MTAHADESVPFGEKVIEFDVSPWGGGAVLEVAGVLKNWMAVVWETDTLNRFKAVLGDPAHQTLWESLMLLLALMAWAEPQAGLAMRVRGDNVGALTCALRLRGRGQINAVAIELAWRKAIYGWCIVPSHLPSEHNELADALSKLAAVPPSAFPQRLKGVPVTRAPSQDSILWKAWIGQPPGNP